MPMPYATATSTVPATGLRDDAGTRGLRGGAGSEGPGRSEAAGAGGEGERRAGERRETARRGPDRRVHLVSGHRGEWEGQGLPYRLTLRMASEWDDGTFGGAEAGADARVTVAEIRARGTSPEAVGRGGGLPDEATLLGWVRDDSDERVLAAVVDRFPEALRGTRAGRELVARVLARADRDGETWTLLMDLLVARGVWRGDRISGGAGGEARAPSGEPAGAETAGGPGSAELPTPGGRAEGLVRWLEGERRENAVTRVLAFGAPAVRMAVARHAAVLSAASTRALLGDDATAQALGENRRLGAGGRAQVVAIAAELLGRAQPGAVARLAGVLEAFGRRRTEGTAGTRDGDAGRGGTGERGTLAQTGSDAVGLALAQGAASAGLWRAMLAAPGTDRAGLAAVALRNRDLPPEVVGALWRGVQEVEAGRAAIRAARGRDGAGEGVGAGEAAADGAWRALRAALAAHPAAPDYVRTEAGTRLEARRGERAPADAKGRGETIGDGTPWETRGGDGTTGDARSRASAGRATGAAGTGAPDGAGREVGGRAGPGATGRALGR